MTHEKLSPIFLALAAAMSCAAHAAQPDPVLLYESCARQGIERIDASVVASWSKREQSRLPKVLDAQNATVRCAADAFLAANAALAGDAERQHALRFHFAKLKSIVELRMPEHATETQRQYRERTARDDAALATLWDDVLTREQPRAAAAVAEADLAEK